MKEGRVYAVLGLIGGIVLLVVGLTMAGGDTVKCGDKVMSADDVCRTISNGDSTERTYEEQKAAGERQSLLFIAGGPALAVISAGYLAWSARRMHHAQAL